MPILIAFSVMPPALFGTVVIHRPNVLTQPASVLGVFTLVSALALFSRQ